MAFRQTTHDVPVLVLHLDPVVIEIQVPPFPDGDRVLAQFCRQLCREAAKLTAALGHDGLTEARHRLTDPQLPTTGHNHTGGF